MVRIATVSLVLLLTGTAYAEPDDGEGRRGGRMERSGEDRGDRGQRPNGWQNGRGDRVARPDDGQRPHGWAQRNPEYRNPEIRRGGEPGGQGLARRDGGDDYGLRGGQNERRGGDARYGDRGGDHRGGQRWTENGRDDDRRGDHRREDRRDDRRHGDDRDDRGYHDRGHNDRGHNDWGHNDWRRNDSGRGDWGRSDWSYSDRRHAGHRGRPGDGHGYRDRDHGRSWYSSHDYRPHYRPTYRYRAPHYVYPRGYFVRSWTFGEYLPRGWYGPSYYLDGRAYGLPWPPIGCEWVRVGRDALLVDVWTGEVLSVYYELFW